MPDMPYRCRCGLQSQQPACGRTFSSCCETQWRLAPPQSNRRCCIGPTAPPLLLDAGDSFKPILPRAPCHHHRSMLRGSFKHLERKQLERMHPLSALPCCYFEYRNDSPHLFAMGSGSAEKSRQLLGWMGAKQPAGSQSCQLSSLKFATSSSRLVNF